jgi:hypothetical protein
LAVLFTVFNVAPTYLGILIMSGRGGVYAAEELKDKKERKVMCLLEKLEVLGELDKLDRRMRITAVRCHYF